MRSSIASAPSTPAEPESFDADHITSSFVKSRGTVLGMSSYSLKAVHVGFSTGGVMHVRLILPEDLCNRSPGFSALVVQEETPSPLPVGCPTDGLPELPLEHCLVKSPSYRLILLLADRGGPALSGGPFRVGIPHQSHMLAPPPEVHELRNPGSYLSGSADAQRLREDDVSKEEGFLRVPAP